MIIGEKQQGMDPRHLPADVAKAVVAMAEGQEFQVFADYLDTLCTMYTASSVWTSDGVDVARGRAQAINALLMALSEAPRVAARPPKKVR